MDQQQPGGRRAGVHRHRMPLAGGRSPHDGQVQLRLLFDRDPAGGEETLRVRERRVLRAPQRSVLIDVGEQPRQDVEQRPIQPLLDLRRGAVE